MRNSARGFTLIEVLITIALLTIIAGFGLIVSMEHFRTTDARGEEDALVALFMRARTHSLADIYGAAHGVCYDEDSGDYVAFKRPYAKGNEEEQIPASKAVTVTGMPECGSGNEIIFAELTADVSPVTLSISDGTLSFSIEINEEGGIMW